MIRSLPPLREEARPVEASPAPSVRLQPLFAAVERAFLLLDRLVHRALPACLNPFGQLGAIANTNLIVAVISGVAMLLWYTPSVHDAYQSLEAVRASGGLGQWMRSLHRYSSDACVLFVLLHALRVAAQRRFVGARWFAWTTGIGLLAVLWLVGWTGYWLVWDVRGQAAALGTARFLDKVPIFAEPFSRSFLTDGSVHSLIFFIVFFLHMLLPLALGLGLWLHLARVSRPRFVTGRAMTAWVVATLAVVSLVYPATSAAKAQMTFKPEGFTLDFWYLWPLWLTERLSGGALWAIFMLGGLGVMAVPWLLARRAHAPEHKARVDLSRCIGCTLCAKDCPFDAISIIPREDGKRWEFQARVNTDLCVGCGVCTGACDSQAIDMPAFDARAIEARANAWIDRAIAEGLTPSVAFRCDKSGSRSHVSPPDCLTLPVPCVGWIGSNLLERLQQRGAQKVLVLGCQESDPPAREGVKWLGQRLAGLREPAFNPRVANRANVVLPEKPAPGRALQIAAGCLLALLLGAATAAISDLPYWTPHDPQPELVVSINHKGELAEARKLTAEELAKRLPHMRNQASASRERVPVRLRITLDGRVAHDESYRPKGLKSDGPSVAVAQLGASPGVHAVLVQIADGPDTNLWTKEWTQQVDFEPRRRRVILFDTRNGFRFE